MLDKAKKLKREDILYHLSGKGHDMIANDISYHIPCMNGFKAAWIPSNEPPINQKYCNAINDLVGDLEIPLFQMMQGYSVKDLRDQYRDLLKSQGVTNGEKYKKKVQN